MADEITATVDDEGNTIVTIPPQIMVPLVEEWFAQGERYGDSVDDYPHDQNMVTVAFSAWLRGAPDVDVRRVEWLGFPSQS